MHHHLFQWLIPQLPGWLMQQHHLFQKLMAQLPRWLMQHHHLFQKLISQLPRWLVPLDILMPHGISLSVSVVIQL